MPATTQAAMSNMIVCAMEAIERGDFDDQNEASAAAGSERNDHE